jgi:hypothetical protein
MRIVIQQLAIFVLPIVLYAAYLMWRRWRARVAGEPQPAWEQGQWYWAIVAGLVLSIATFVVLDAFTEKSPMAPFRPPSVKD